MPLTEVDSTPAPWLQFLREPRFLLAAAVLVISSLTLLCLFFWLLSQNSTDKIIISHASDQASSSDSDTQIWVDVSGAVNAPGVYVLAANSRVAEAIEAAGGVSAEVDTVRFESLINLAAKVEDQQKLVIPRQTQATGSVSGDSKATGLINVNTASQSELETLPGVGSKRAEDLINGRPYASFQDLSTKQPIPLSLITKLKELITF